MVYNLGMSELSPHPRHIEEPEASEAAQEITHDLKRASRLNDDIQAFLHPEAGATPGGSELYDRLQDFAERAGVEIDDTIHPLDQIIQISNLVALELARLRQKANV